MSKVSKVQARLATPATERELNASATPKGVVSPVPPVTGTIAKNNFWDEAKNMYVNSMFAIEATHGTLAAHLKTLVSDEGALNQVKDQQGLLDNINLLFRDIKEHIDRLNAIHERHKDRSGGTVTPDDNMHLIQINGLYHDANEIYNNTIMPTVSHIFEQIGAAEVLLQAELEENLRRNAEQAKDPNFVTDVVVKDHALEVSADGPITIAAQEVTLQGTVVAEGTSA